MRPERMRSARPVARAWALAAAALVMGFAAWRETQAHPVPYVTVVCTFVDPHGRPISGLTASLQLRGAVNGGRGAGAEADIVKGRARIDLRIPDGYSGPMHLKIFDPWRNRVMMKDSTGTLSDSLTFEFIHRDAGHGPAGWQREAGKSAPAFTLAWSPDSLAPALAREVAQGEAIDRRNQEQLEKKLAEMRSRGWTP